MSGITGQKVGQKVEFPVITNLGNFIFSPPFLYRIGLNAISPSHLNYNDIHCNLFYRYINWILILVNLHAIQKILQAESYYSINIAVQPLSVKHVSPEVLVVTIHKLSCHKKLKLPSTHADFFLDQLLNIYQ